MLPCKAKEKYFKKQGRCVGMNDDVYLNALQKRV